MKGTVWYLVAGTDAGAADVPRRAASRSVEPTAEPVERPDGFDLAEHWKTVVAEMDERRAPYRVDRPLEPRRARLAARLVAGRGCTSGETGDDGRVEVTLADVRAAAGGGRARARSARGSRSSSRTRSASHLGGDRARTRSRCPDASDGSSPLAMCRSIKRLREGTVAADGRRDPRGGAAVRPEDQRVREAVAGERRGRSTGRWTRSRRPRASC